MSPGGTKTKKVARTEVDTPTFKQRLAENARRGVKSRVDLSLHMHDQLLDNVDKEGFITKAQRNSGKQKTGGKVNVIGIKAHTEALEPW